METTETDNPIELILNRWPGMDKPLTAEQLERKAKFAEVVLFLTPIGKARRKRKNYRNWNGDLKMPVKRGLRIALKNRNYLHCRRRMLMIMYGEMVVL